MAYHINEELSDLIFNVINGDEVEIKVKGGTGGGGGDSRYVIKLGEDVTPTDANLFSSLRTLAEIKKAAKDNLKIYDEVFLHKDRMDVTKFLIAFLGGAEFGSFSKGMLGTGGAIDSEGRGELESLLIRSELVVPKITFNCIDVISGDKANTFAYGTIKSVDEENQIATLDLLDEQIGSLHVNDICRGVFHNIKGGNTNAAHDNMEDENGFYQYAGFSTSYFSPTEILVNKEGEFAFKYILKRPGITPHPMPGMNFFAYGNFLDSTRQSITYETRYYTRRLKNMAQWEINPTVNIAMQDGLLDGLKIGGMEMKGYGTFQENSYLTGATIQFTQEQKNELTPYSFSLSNDTAVVKKDNRGNITPTSLSVSLIVYKGSRILHQADILSKDAYIVAGDAKGCVIDSIVDGIMTLSGFTGDAYVDITINCEGNYASTKRFTVTAVRDGEDTVCIDLSEEYVNIACDDKGKPIKEVNIPCEVKALSGIGEIPFQDLAVNVPSGVTVTKSNNGFVVTQVEASAESCLTINVSANCLYNNNLLSRSAKMVLNKVIPGKPGEVAVVDNLVLTSSFVKVDKNGNRTPANIYPNLKRTKGKTSTTYTSAVSGRKVNIYKDRTSPLYGQIDVGADCPTGVADSYIRFDLIDTGNGNQVLDSETVVIVKDGNDGEPGKDSDVPGQDGDDARAVVPSISTISKTVTGSYSPSSFTVYSYKGASLESNYIHVWYKVKGQPGYTYMTGTDQYKQSLVVNLSSNIDYEHLVVRLWVNQTGHGVTNINTTGYAASLTIPIIEDGKVGASPRYCGEFKNGTKYVYDDEWRDIVIKGGNVYQVKTHGTSVTSAPPSSSWEQSSKFSFVAMDTALIDKANVAGFIFNRIGFSSDGIPYGTLVSQNTGEDGKPVFSVDTKTGKVKMQEADVKGNLCANTIQLKSNNFFFNNSQWYWDSAAIVGLPEHEGFTMLNLKPGEVEVKEIFCPVISRSPHPITIRGDKYANSYLAPYDTYLGASYMKAYIPDIQGCYLRLFGYESGGITMWIIVPMSEEAKKMQIVYS